MQIFKMYLLTVSGGEVEHAVNGGGEGVQSRRSSLIFPAGWIIPVTYLLVSLSLEHGAHFVTIE